MTSTAGQKAESGANVEGLSLLLFSKSRRWRDGEQPPNTALQGTLRDKAAQRRLALR